MITVTSAVDTDDGTAIVVFGAAVVLGGAVVVGAAVVVGGLVVVDDAFPLSPQLAAITTATNIAAAPLRSR